jgi:FKBP-type peptidyl-prolyl cis-trans isomerase FklB
MRLAVTLAAVALMGLAACDKLKPGHGEAAAPAASPAENKAFLEKTAKEPGVKALPSGILYKVVRAGPADGKPPSKEDEVKVHYEGKLISGRVFDSSYERGEPAALPLEGLIPAWIEALPLMKPGDEWILYVPPEQGYGADGAGDIPPNSVLIFRIELLDVLRKGGGTALG